MTDTCDLYSVLCLNRDATQDDIRKAYKYMALQHHPDKNGGDDTKFKKINEAYQILSDSDKRKMYDLKYEDNINLDILYKFATILMDIVQEKLRDKVKHNISKDSKDSKDSKNTIVAPVKLKIAVDLEDIYHAKVKKIVVKVKRKEGDTFVFKSIPLYISLLNYETSYVFHKQGDESESDVDGQRGDVIVNLDIKNDNVMMDTLFCKYDLHMECEISLYEYLYGVNKSIKYFNERIEVQKVPELLKDCLTHEVENRGLPYIDSNSEDDEVKRGRLHIHFKLQISKVPRDVLLQYENIFKTYFNNESNESNE
jgi:DnaJ-class molecular chaperone